MILNQMKMLDQQIAAARCVAQQRAYFVPRRLIYLAPFGAVFGFAATATWMTEAFDFRAGLRHRLMRLRP